MFRSGLQSIQDCAGAGWKPYPARSMSSYWVLGRLASNATPSQKMTNRFELAGTRSPGTRIPAKFKGSAAEIVMVSPVGGNVRVARRDSTAAGNANCSPRKPLTICRPHFSAVFQPSEASKTYASAVGSIRE